MEPFRGSFTPASPISEAGIAAAVEVLRSGRLHRYSAAEGETPAAARLERAFADWQGARYALAVASGGQALQIALRAVGVSAGDPVLMNAWTLAPVPGAIACLGACPVLVETTPDLVIDLADLDAKAQESGARVLLLSHMRGHLCDMDALADWAEARGVTVVEDCAHAMGGLWRDRRAGSIGQIGCFSTQSYKHVDSGEGGLLVTDDDVVAARATVLSGSYMMYPRHGAGPPDGAFADARLDMPNGSARMDNLRAAILLPQLAALPDNVARWNALHDTAADAISEADAVALPQPLPAARRVGSSLQFRLPGLSSDVCEGFVGAAGRLGVVVAWYGAAEPSGYVSAHASWRYAGAQPLPRTDAILATLFDLRLPLHLTPACGAQIGAILAHCAEAARTGRAA